MKTMSPLEHWQRAVTGNWAGVELAPLPDLPARPLHPDGDALWRRSLTSFKVPRSDQTIALLRQEPLNIYTGGTAITHDGRTDGIRLCEAHPDDPVFTVSRDYGRTKLTVTEYMGPTTPWGARVRIGAHMTVQGYPMRAFADHKLHIFDPVERTVTEIQYIVDNEHNPVVQFFLALLRKEPAKFSCHGVQQYRLDAPSTAARGSSAAGLPLAGTPEITFADFEQGFEHMTVGAVPRAHPSRFVRPAHGTDGRGTNPDSIQMGQVLKLTAAAHRRLSAGAGPQLQFVLNCWHRYGVMIVDTADHVTTGLEHNKAWDQAQLSPIRTITAVDFEVHQLP